VGLVYEEEKHGSYLIILKEEQLVKALDFTNTYPLEE